MKIVQFPEGREEWLLWRSPKSTGSKLKKLLSRKTDRKTGLKEFVFDPTDVNLEVDALIAARFIGSAALVEDDASDEKAMDRGTRLEKDAVARFVKETGKKVNTTLVGWEREDDPSIALSPDGFIGKSKIKEAVEAKCLSAKRHMHALRTGKVPEDYELQADQYFAVNEDLVRLYFVLYDDRFQTGLDYVCFVIKRKDRQNQIDALLAAQREVMDFVRKESVRMTSMVKAERDEGGPIPSDCYGTSIAGTPEMIDALRVDRVSDLERIAAGIKDRAYD